jgi:hypothetical protein
MATDVFKAGPPDSDVVNTTDDEFQRRSSLSSRKHIKPVVIDASYRVGKRIGKGNFGEVRLGEIKTSFG